MHPADRGQLTPSWRHAGAAGDSRLLGELIERYGPCQLWLREGITRLISAGRFLTPELLARYPRLDLLHCVILVLSSKQNEAVARVAAIAERTDGFSRDREGGDPEALAIDAVYTRVAVLHCTQALPFAEVVSTAAAGGPAAEIVDDRARVLACARHTLLCVANYERAHFEESRRHGLRAQKHVSGETRFGDVFVHTCLGMAAMVQGRVREARTRYRRARQVAREFFSSDPCIALSIDVLTIELDIEQNREKAIGLRTLRNLTELRDIWAEVYSTAICVSAELMLAQYDGQAVVKLLSSAVAGARATGVLNLSNHMSALLAHYLVEVGRSGEAGRVWREEGLPCGAAELLDLERQSWRVMEALACARIRLLAETAQYGAAQELAGGLCAVASEHRLIRTLLRGLALSMLVAHRARQADRALGHLAGFLRAARGVDYPRPLFRHRAASQAVLRRLIAAEPDEELRAEAEAMQARLADAPTDGGQFFSGREIEVLAAAARGLRSKEIGVRLGISDEGVRYHLKNIYRKAGVGKREDAIEYARSLGVLSG